MDERLNAFLATCHVVIYMYYVITCDKPKMMMKMMMMMT